LDLRLPAFQTLSIGKWNHPKETLVLGNDGWSKTIEEMKNAKECLSKDEGYTLIYITASVSHQ